MSKTVKKIQPIRALVRQKKELQKQINAARMQAYDRVSMSPDQYRAAVEKDLGLTIEQGGTLFGVSKRTSYRWALGELPVPVSVAHLLRTMRKYGIRPEDLDPTVREELAA